MELNVVAEHVCLENFFYLEAIFSHNFRGHWGKILLLKLLIVVGPPRKSVD